MYTEEIHIGLTTKTPKVIGTIEFEEDDLIRDYPSGYEVEEGKIDLYQKNYYLGEWLVTLWGRDRKGSLVSTSIDGGYDLAEWEGESTIDLLRFWKLTKIEVKQRYGRMYYVFYSGKRHWDIDEELYQSEDDFLPVLFSLATDDGNELDMVKDGIHYVPNGANTVAVVKPEDEKFKYSGCLDIPATVTFKRKTYTVTEIRNIKENKGLIEIKLPDTITRISEWAISQNYDLRRINFPESLRIIEEGAFWGCTSLKTLELPACGLCKCAFAFCEGVTKLVMTGVTSIGDEVFKDLKSLKSVVLPPSIEEIGPRTFSNCTKLKTIILNEGLQSIDLGSFDNCGIEELFIPKSVRSIRGYCSLSRLKSIVVDTDNEKYSSVDGVLYSKDMSRLEYCPARYEGEFIVPEGVKTISNSAFYYCENITKVIIPDSVEYICHESFEGCNNMQTVIIGNGVREIGEEAFKWCEKLSSVVFGNGIERIEERAFKNCRSLVTVELPSSIQRYSVTLFEDCRSLSELIIPEWMEKRRNDIMDYASGKKYSSWF